MKEEQVQKIVTRWFKEQGFDTYENIRLNTENNIDLVAKKSTEQWVIEIKGDYDRNTAQYNVNFDTGMGQILKSITTLNDNIRYAVCIPFTRTECGEKLSYRLILKKYSKSLVFERLNISLILVQDDGSVEIVDPKDVKKFLNTIDPRIKVR